VLQLWWRRRQRSLRRHDGSRPAANGIGIRWVLNGGGGEQQSQQTSSDDPPWHRAGPTTSRAVRGARRYMLDRIPIGDQAAFKI